MPKFRMKISTMDNEPVVRAKAERIEDFEPIIRGLKEKYGGKRGR